MTWTYTPFQRPPSKPTKASFGRGCTQKREATAPNQYCAPFPPVQIYSYRVPTTHLLWLGPNQQVSQRQETDIKSISLLKPWLVEPWRQSERLKQRLNVDGPKFCYWRKLLFGEEFAQLPKGFRIDIWKQETSDASRLMVLTPCHKILMLCISYGFLGVISQPLSYNPCPVKYKTWFSPKLVVWISRGEKKFKGYRCYYSLVIENSSLKSMTILKKCL